MDINEGDSNVGKSTRHESIKEEHDDLDGPSENLKPSTNSDEDISCLENTTLSNSTSIVEGTEISVDTESEPGVQWATAGELGVEDQEVPTAAAGIHKHKFLPGISGRPVDMIVGTCTLQMAKEQRAIRHDEKQAVFSILKAFNSITPLTASIAEDFRLQGLLRLILGETRFECKPFEYPEPLQRNALILFTRLDVELEAAASEARATSSSPEPNPSSSANARDSKWRRTSGTPPQAIVTSSRSGHLDLDDPVLTYAMRGIVFSGSQRRSYRLDPNDSSHVRNCNIFGHNGLRIGQWWPLRVCALRDGAHGAMQGGIAGNSRSGAFSVVVSSMFTIPFPPPFASAVMFATLPSPSVPILFSSFQHDGAHI